MINRILGAIFLLSFSMPYTVVLADEPLVGYTYTTDMLPKGKVELEQWLTLREGRSQGKFHLLEAREELSYGLADNFQLSGYVNLAHTSVRNDAPSGLTAPPEAFADYHFDPRRGFTKSRFESVSVEGIYRVASPITAPLGTALYAQSSIGPGFRELDTRLIVQKNFLDDRLILAGNAGFVFGWRKIREDILSSLTGQLISSDAPWQHKTTAILSGAASFRFTSNWNIGAELRNERGFSGHNPFDSERGTNSAFYSGPSLHFGGEHMFVTLTALFQLPIASDYTSESSVSSVVDDLLNSSNSEKFRFRIKAGYYF